MNHRGDTSGCKRTEQEAELAARGKVGHIGLGLNIFEMNIRPETSIEEVKGIDKESRVLLARISMQQA